MKKAIRVCFLLIYILVFQTGCNESGRVVNEASIPQPGAGQNVGKWGETVSNLRCRLETNKKVYRVGDEITFTLALENVGDEGILICYRGGFFVSDMLSFKHEDGTTVQKAILVKFKLAPLGQKDDFHIISPRKTHLVEVTGNLLEQNLYGTYLAKQEDIGNLILKFDQAFMLGRPEIFYAAFQYKMPADWRVAKENPELWTGTVKSGEVTIEIGK